jgi:DNA-binding XRE family transcriptional regulator
MVYGYNSTYFNRTYPCILGLNHNKIGVMKPTANAAESRAGERTVVRSLLTRVRAHRLRRNWTQAELARRAGISVQSYQNFETGYGNITLAHLLRILGALGLASRFALLVPEVEEERTLKNVSRPPRQRARAKKTQTGSHG